MKTKITCIALTVDSIHVRHLFSAKCTPRALRAYNREDERLERYEEMTMKQVQRGLGLGTKQLKQHRNGALVNIAVN